MVKLLSTEQNLVRHKTVTVQPNGGLRRDKETRVGVNLLAPGPKLVQCQGMSRPADQQKLLVARLEVGDGL